MGALPALALAAVLFPFAALAQTPPAPRQPSAEIQAEGTYYIGNWVFTGDSDTAPRADRKNQASERLEWMPGRFFLMARSYAGDNWAGTTIIGYDESRKVLTHTSFTAQGNVEVMTGTIAGDTETWTGDAGMGGAPTRQRFTIKRLSPTRYAFRLETAPANGGDWSLLYSGYATKTP
jgi:hypothetical protein